MFNESVMPSNHLILCHPLFFLPSVFPSIRVFSKELAFCIRWPKYCSFSFSISPSDKHSGLISFRIGWISFQSKGLSRYIYILSRPRDGSCVCVSCIGSRFFTSSTTWETPYVCMYTCMCVCVCVSIFAFSLIIFYYSLLQDSECSSLFCTVNACSLGHL